jgi:hypothetical protein
MWNFVYKPVSSHMQILNSIPFSRIFILIGSFIVFACSSENEKSEQGMESAELSVEERDLELAQEGLKKIPEWTAFWKSVEPSFDVGDFSFKRGFSYEILEWPEENIIIPGNVFYPHLLHQPEQKGVVDLYSYKVAFDEKGVPLFNPDSEVIYFKSDGMRERLLFMGPSGAFEEAVWVSPDHLLVAGNFEEEEGIRPILWLIYPEEHRYMYFENTLVSTKYPILGYIKRKLKQLDFLG